MELAIPGYGDGHQGGWIMPPELLRHQINLWWNPGYDIHIHCNGSLALSIILDTLEKAVVTHPGKDQRLIIEHLGVSSPTEIERMKKLGMGVSANAYYSMADTYAQDSNLGPVQGGQIVRLGTLAREGTPFGLHSDFPMAPIKRLFMAWIATNRVTALGTQMAPEENVPVFKALQGITIDAAHVLRLETITGSIAQGKKADFVLLAESPMKVDTMKIKDIEILGTAWKANPTRSTPAHFARPQTMPAYPAACPQFRLEVPHIHIDENHPARFAVTSGSGGINGLVPTSLV